MIRRNVELEARLIDDLLDLTRVANGKLRLSLETVDVHDVMDSVLELFRSEIQVKQQDVHVDKRRDAPLRAGRSRAAAADAVEPDSQCREVHAGRRPYLCAHARRTHARADIGRRYGHRHRAGTDRQTLQCVRAGQPEHDAAVRRPGPRSRDHQGADRRARRHGDRAQPRRALRRDLHDHACRPRPRRPATSAGRGAGRSASGRTADHSADRRSRRYRRGDGATDSQPRPRRDGGGPGRRCAWPRPSSRASI